MKVEAVLMVSIVRDVAAAVSAPLAILLVNKITHNQMFIDQRFVIKGTQVS
ncbi:hypothetical protein ENSA7_33240 [Enhygromyxa salina]|uniref:Uncharacterized protein n=2 Tax=Enhygromyxa salina TaxID=215803 RepID=A0A2S9YPI0_9BACT|nr:hypothetical protein ENSA7_33240 [Enhygromyxa salina]